jgi:hypothetical protein
MPGERCNTAHVADKSQYHSGGHDSMQRHLSEHHITPTASPIVPSFERDQRVYRSERIAWLKLMLEYATEAKDPTLVRKAMKWMAESARLKVRMLPVQAHTATDEALCSLLYLSASCNVHSHTYLWHGPHTANAWCTQWCTCTHQPWYVVLWSNVWP